MWMLPTDHLSHYSHIFVGEGAGPTDIFRIYIRTSEGSHRVSQYLCRSSVSLDALKTCPEDVLVMGNLDSVKEVKQSTAEEVYKATKELLDKAFYFVERL